MERDYEGFEVESNSQKQVEDVTPEPAVAVEEEVTEPTTTDEPKEEVNEAPKPQSKSRAQKRIEALIQEKHELTRQLEEAKSKSEPKPKALDPDDFEDYDDYLSAVAENKPKEVTKEAPKHDEMAVVIEQIQEKFEDSREKYPDFDEKVANPSLPLTNDLLKAINESDDAGEVAYYLANNPAEAKRLSQLSLGKMAIEVGKIELKLSQPEPPQKPTVKKTTTAPEPINPVGGANGLPRSIEQAETYSEYEAMRREQSSKRNGFI